jgi:hypothetical protein
MTSKEKIRLVMDEFKRGKLRSSSGKKVTNPKQALAIALSYGEGRMLPIVDAVRELVDGIGLEEFSKIGDDCVLEVKDVMLFATGVFNGVRTDVKDLHAMVDSVRELGRVPIVKITHSEEGENVFLGSYPFSVGEVDISSLRVIGDYLVGTLCLFKWVIEFIYKGYLRGISAEVIHNLRVQGGRVYSRVLDAVALLGAEREAQWERLRIYGEKFKKSYAKEKDYDIIMVYSYGEVIGMDGEEKKVEGNDVSPVVNEKGDSGLFDFSKFKEDLWVEIKNYIGELLSSMLSNNGVDSGVKEVSEDVMVSKYKEDIEYLKGEVRRMVLEKEALEDKIFVDGLIKEGKLLPSNRDKVLGLLGKVNKFNYSEGSGIKDDLKKFLISLGTSMSYSEEIADSVGDDIDVDISDIYEGRSREEYFFEKLNTTRAYKYAEERGISFEQAVMELFGK